MDYALYYGDKFIAYDSDQDFLLRKNKETGKPIPL